jgi:hypothetical protein
VRLEIVGHVMSVPAERCATAGMQFEGETLPSNWILADVHLAGIRTPPY